MNRGGAEAQRGNEITELVIGAAIRIHKALGPGLLESAYEECLCYELSKAGLKIERQRPVPVVYETVKLDCGYRLDLVVEDLVVLELKCVEHLRPIHEAQLLTYLKLTGIPLGLLINFHVPTLREGLKRLVLNFPSSSSAPPRLRGSIPPPSV
jgi:GxxExxY protein